MSNCVKGVFPGFLKGGGGGWCKVMYRYMGLCPAE